MQRVRQAEAEGSTRSGAHAYEDFQATRPPCMRQCNRRACKQSCNPYGAELSSDWFPDRIWYSLMSIIFRVPELHVCFSHHFHSSILCLHQR